jgi:hypothetical protein
MTSGGNCNRLTITYWKLQKFCPSGGSCNILFTIRFQLVMVKQLLVKSFDFDFAPARHAVN